MPVYIRKPARLTPQSIDRVSDEDDADYLLDPDQLIDDLPQPYRNINKLLTRLLDAAWEIIEDKQKKRLAEAKRIKPPQYDALNKLPIIAEATALTASDDGKYLFAGLPNGLAVVDTSCNQLVNQWEEERAEINSIHAYNFTANIILLVTVDDMAVARLFLFAFDRLLFVKSFNEIEGNSSKLLVNCCEASGEGDYIGVVFENPSTKEVWFEAHKTPRDVWLSELQTVEEKIQKLKEKSGDEKEEQEAPRAESTMTNQESDVEKEQEKPDESPRPSSPSVSVPQPHSHRFSHPAVVLRVKQPAHYTANTSSSLASACQKVDALGTVLGMGLTHIMSSTHLEARDAAFMHMHAGLVKFLTPDEEKARRREQEVMTATFHFCKPGRLFLTGLESPGQQDRSNCVALWWKGSSHLQQYSLTKVSHQGKGGATELDHRPDVVWPFSNNISCSAVTSCTSYIAIGLNNGNVVIWDRYIGLQKNVVNMGEKACSVGMLRFLDPTIYQPPGMDYPLYPTRRGCCYMVVQYTDSTQYLYDVGHNVYDQPLCVGEIPEKDDDVQTLLQSVPDLPELCLVVQKNGTLFLKDVLTGVRVCQLNLPGCYKLQSPWEPVVSFGARGQFLYVKGIGEEDENEGTSSAGLFVFPLRSFKTLDHYWRKSYNLAKLLVHSTVEIRLEALMKERIVQQPLRKNRLQLRWGMLHSDLSVIQNAREVPSNTINYIQMTPSSGRSIRTDILAQFKPIIRPIN